MSWTTPRTWVNGEVVDASMLNTHVRDNLNYLKTQVAAHFLLSGASIVPSATYGCIPPVKTEMASNKQNFMLPGFLYTADTIGGWTLVVMPDDYNGGVLSARIIWTSVAAASAAVYWRFRGVCVADSGPLDATWGSWADTTDSAHASVNNSCMISSPINVTVGGTPAAGKLCQFEVARLGSSGSDTLNATAYLLGVALTYTRT